MKLFGDHLPSFINDQKWSLFENSSNPFSRACPTGRSDFAIFSDYPDDTLVYSSLILLYNSDESDRTRASAGGARMNRRDIPAAWEEGAQNE